MKSYIIIFLMICVNPLQALAQGIQAEYKLYLDNAYSALSEGRVEDAQKSYNVYMKMTGETDKELESLIKLKQSEGEKKSAAASSQTVVIRKTTYMRVKGTEIDHEWVDLGLSVKWATCNIGATNPEDKGDYFAWGENVTKKDYDSDHYKHYNLFAKKKYVTDKGAGLVGNGKVDGKTSLDPEDDAAHVKWGGKWRMPTKAEFEELRTECTWKWTTVNGMYGYEITSNKPGYTNCSIFLPASGYHDGKELSGKNTQGRYWSNTLDTSGSQSDAWFLFFKASDICLTSFFRSSGLTIRPVCQ